MLLLPRLDADALLHEGALQVSAGASSRTRSSSRRTGAAASDDPEFELADTGVFDDDRYFDVFVEYAKAAPNDILIRITVANRGPEAARAARAADALVPQHLVVGPHGRGLLAEAAHRARRARASVVAEHATLGALRAATPTRAGVGRTPTTARSPRTRPTRSGSSASPNRTPYVKDAFHDYVVHGRRDAVNPAGDGHQGGARTTSSTCRRAARRRSACASPAGSRRGA